MGDGASDSRIIVTGAADNLIMAWKNQTVVQTYKGE
jgi:hypothetical protein